MSAHVSAYILHRGRFPFAPTMHLSAFRVQGARVGDTKPEPPDFKASDLIPSIMQLENYS